MKTSAIIVTYRTGAVLAECLAAVARAAELDEIVVVDNGNDPRETSMLDAVAVADPRVAVLRGRGNVGFAAACNAGVRRASGEVLVFVNPDVILAPDAVVRLKTALAAVSAPTIIGGDLRDGEGRPERGSRRDRLTLWRAIVSFTGLSRLERILPVFRDFNRHRDPLPTEPVAVGAVSGALMVLRRADFDRIGGFDEAYFLHVEDLDLCRRAEDAGWRVLFQPGPHGAHLRSSSDVDASAIARHKAQGMAHYFRKFAANSFERALAQCAGALLIIAAPRR